MLGVSPRRRGGEGLDATKRKACRDGRERKDVGAQYGGARAWLRRGWVPRGEVDGAVEGMGAYDSVGSLG